MKKYIKIIILFFAFNNAFGQQVVNLSTYNAGRNNNKYFKDLNNVFPNYVGTWEYVYGNQTFRLVLWKETMVSYDEIDSGCFVDEIQGHFMMIENAGQPNESIIYRSDKNYRDSENPWIPAIFLLPNTNATQGTIIDNCILPNPQDIYMYGVLKFTINTTTTPYTAHWEASEGKGMHFTDGPVLRVPRDIILTKR